MKGPDELTADLEKEFVSAPCIACSRDTNHKTLAKVYELWNSEEVKWDTRHRIIQCQGCFSISFSQEETCSEDSYITDDGMEYYPAKRKYYPDRITGRTKMRGYHHLPSKVAGIYDEAHASLCANRLIMTGFGIRAITEAVCRDKSISNGSLKDKIDTLKRAGYITKEGSTILHNLRFMGNEAVHELKVHKRSELEAGFDVLEHLLQGVYIIPYKAQKLPRYEQS